MAWHTLGSLLLLGSVLYLAFRDRNRLDRADVTWGPSRSPVVFDGPDRTVFAACVYDAADPTKPVIHIVPPPPFDWSQHEGL